MTTPNSRRVGSSSSAERAKRKVQRKQRHLQASTLELSEYILVLTNLEPEPGARLTSWNSTAVAAGVDSARPAENHCLIAFDLPGHGQSSNSPDPTRSYTRPGFADALVGCSENWA
jgi:hypothetical protein